MKGQLTLDLAPRAPRVRELPPVERLYRVLARQGFGTSRRPDRGSWLLRPCLGGSPIDWSMSTDERGLPAQGVYEALCGLYCCGGKVFQTVHYSERYAERQTRGRAC